MDQLVEGFDLTGMLPESNVFARRLRPAVMSCNELRKVADLSRDGMLEVTRSSGDWTLHEQLYAATTREVEKGFIEGPLDPKRIPPGASLTRRFGVKQKNKTRPIHDYKASFEKPGALQMLTIRCHLVMPHSTWMHSW